MSSTDSRHDGQLQLQDPISAQALARSQTDPSFIQGHTGAIGSSNSLATFLAVPFIHKRAALTAFLMCLVAGWLTLLLWPRTYESESKILILVGRESVALDPSATTGQTLLLQKTQQEEVNSALELLSSRRVSELVVDKLGAQAVIDGHLSASTDEIVPLPAWKKTLNSVRSMARGGLDFGLRAVGLRDALSDRELAIMRVQTSVEINSPKNSTVIGIHAYSKSPEMAQALAKCQVETFKEQHLLANQTKGSKSFFYDQSTTVESQLSQLLEQRQLFLQERNIISIDASRSILTEQKGAVDRDMIVASGELEQTLAEIDNLTESQQATEDEIVANKQKAQDSTWSAMRQRVYELELLEKSQTSLYTEDNPMLAATREQLKGARQILEKLKSERTDQSTTPNPLKVRLEEQLSLLSARAAGLRSIVVEKKKQNERIDNEISLLLASETELVQMDHRIDQLTGSLSSLRQKLEEARIIDALQAVQISNVSVFQPATLVQRATKPNKKLLGAAFLMFGVIGGLGLAYLRESNSTNLRTVEQIEEGLDYPVVARIQKNKKIRANKDMVGKGAEQLYSQCRGVVSRLLLIPNTQNEDAERGRSLGIIGVNADCGASTLAMALAITSSREFGIHTTLVDADGKQRSVSKTFDLNGAPGLAELVQGDVSPQDCIQRFGNMDLHLVSCSSSYSQSASIDGNSKATFAALAQFLNGTELVIVDLPPANNPDQTIGLAQQLDYAIVVVEAGKTDRRETARLLRQLSDGGTQVIGVVLNKSTDSLPRWMVSALGSTA